LLEFSLRAGEEKHCGKQNSVCEVLTGNVASLARFLLTVSSLCGRFGGFARNGTNVPQIALTELRQ
jgi:hypothetical protein